MGPPNMDPAHKFYPFGPPPEGISKDDWLVMINKRKTAWSNQQSHLEMITEEEEQKKNAKKQEEDELEDRLGSVGNLRHLPGVLLGCKKRSPVFDTTQTQTSESAYLPNKDDDNGELEAATQLMLSTQDESEEESDEEELLTPAFKKCYPFKSPEEKRNQFDVTIKEALEAITPGSESQKEVKKPEFTLGTPLPSSDE